MKIWTVVARATEDARDDGLEDDLFGNVYRSLDSVKREAEDHLRSVWDDLDSYQIEWKEIRSNLWHGKPEENVDLFYEANQGEVLP